MFLHFPIFWRDLIYIIPSFFQSGNLLENYCFKNLTFPAPLFYSRIASVVQSCFLYFASMIIADGSKLQYHPSKMPPVITVIHIIGDVYHVCLGLPHAHKYHSLPLPPIHVMITIQDSVYKRINTLPNHHRLYRLHPAKHPIQAFLCSIVDFITTILIALHDYASAPSTSQISTLHLHI